MTRLVFPHKGTPFAITDVLTIEHIATKCPCIVLYYGGKSENTWSDIVGYFLTEHDCFRRFDKESYEDYIKILDYNNSFEGIINE